nr:immunoglobulin heavy chain junction region [Macaca mulatta]MOY28338.1 immunoglobulin heavy chain junction region [Macaca mulatta]
CARNFGALPFDYW